MAASMNSRGDYQWTSYEHQRPAPPLPSLPPWASAVSTSGAATPPVQSISRPLENGDASQGGAWRRPTSYFGAMKRLPFQGAQGQPMGQEIPPNDDEERRRFAPHQPMIQPPNQPQYHPQHPSQYPLHQPPYQAQYQSHYPSQYQPQGYSQPPHQPQQQYHQEEHSGGTRDWLFGNGATPVVSEAATNQQEHEPPAPESVSEPPKHAEQPRTAQDSTEPATNDPEPTAAVEVAPLAMDGAFFRPWKASGDNNNSNNNDDEDSGEQTANKWKVRALFNPFAKRKAPVKAALVVQQPQEREAVSPPQPQQRQEKSISEQPASDGEENPAAPSPLPMVRTKAPPRRVVTKRPEPPPSEPAPVRPSTPVLAPAPISMSSSESAYDRQPSSSQQRPLRPLRSREAKQLPQLNAPPSVVPETEPELPKAFANISDLRRSTAVLAPIETADQRPHSRDISPEKDDNEIDDNVAKMLKSVPSKPPTQLQQLKQQQKQSQQKAKKGATLDALKEIQRKREERRNAQAEEKQRIQSELKAHGDDAGYKFRRLIQKYRDALPAHQKPSQAKVSADTSIVLPPPSSTQRLSVFVRKRPLAKKELKAKGYDIITCLYAGVKAQPVRKELMCHEPKLKVDCSEALENHQFHFDGVFDDDQDNTAVYNAALGPMVPFLIQSSSTASASLTVFAYGQTGSGKTYTMKSMYRQAASDLFARLTSLNVSVGVSFYEIYMNQVNDLLNQRTRVQVMEDGDGVVQLQGLKEIAITSADELMELIQIGEESRATSANAVHDDSSRSHALLRVTMYNSDAKNEGTVLARLSMVDLAGSERACDTQSDSKSTRMEGAEINKSLLALKECIRALDRGATHIPFRQSKLTQLLRDSFLCANSKTVMIATVSPWSESCNHTLNTLRYADRLKEIGSS